MHWVYIVYSVSANDNIISKTFKLYPNTLYIQQLKFYTRFQLTRQEQN